MPKITYTSPLLLFIITTPLFFAPAALTAAMFMGERANTKLFHGIIDDNIDDVTIALNNKAKVNNTDINNLLPIQHAAYFCCHPNIFDTLFSSGANPHAQTQLKENLLHLCLKGANILRPHFLETIKTLLKHTVSLQSVNAENDTPLHRITTLFQKSVIYNGPPHNRITRENSTKEYYHAIKIFLFAGADHEAINNEKQTPLDLISQENKALFERLINIVRFFKSPNTLPLEGRQQPTEEEQKLWDELAPIREIQQKLLITPPLEE